MRLGVRGIQFYQASLTCNLQGVLGMTRPQDRRAILEVAVWARGLNAVHVNNKI